MDARSLSLLAAAVLALAAQDVLAGPGDTLYVKPLQAQLYAAPSDGAEKTFIVAIGRKLIEFQRQGDWIQVGVDKTGGRDGWIRSEDVSTTDADGLRY